MLKGEQKHGAEVKQSSAEFQNQSKNALRQELCKTVVFLIAALVALVFGSVAWFIANLRVESGGVSIISAYETVRLATTGSRQTPEQELLKLPEGTQMTYNASEYYWTESGQIALRLSEEYTVSPGATGTITFYIIPTHDGTAGITLHLGLAGFQAVKTDHTITSAKRAVDPILDALISGHILLFRNLQDGQYSGWLNDSRLTISLPADTQKDVPYPVTLYWIWPLRYENMEEDLYDIASEEYRNTFLPFIEAQATNLTPISDSNYCYSRVFLTKTPELLGDRAARNRAYNQADEYIGVNANYLYLTIQASPMGSETP